jgi:class 3 adenylate cyclase
VHRSCVNVAARIEGLTSKLGKPMLMSESFTKHTPRKTRDVGAFELKGVPDKTRVFELV